MANTGTKSMADKQPPALRLADELESYVGRPVCTEAAAELRRLHALCWEMLAELYVYRASEHLRDVTAALKERIKS